MALGRVVVTLLVVDGVAVRFVDEVLLVVVTARVELPGLVVDGLVVRVVDDVVVRVVPALVVAEAVRVVAFVLPVYLDVDEPLLAALADEPEEVILVDDVLVLRLERLAIPKPDPPPE